MKSIYDLLNDINDEMSLIEDVDDMSTLRNEVKTYIPEVLNMIKTIKDSGETHWRTFLENSPYQTVEASILIHPQGYFNKVPKGVSRFTLSYRFKHSNDIQSYRISITEYEDIMIDVDTGFWDYYRNNEYQGRLDALKGFIRYFDDVKESFDKTVLNSSDKDLVEDVACTEYTAEFTPYGETGTRILVASDIHELISKLIEGGYKFHPVSKKELLDWETSNKKKFYARCLTVRRGEDEMTEYTSL